MSDDDQSEGIPRAFGPGWRTACDRCTFETEWFDKERDADRAIIAHIKEAHIKPAGGAR